MSVGKCYLCLLFIYFLCGCNDKSTVKTEQQLVSKNQKVKTGIVQKSSFSTIISSNGRLEASKKVDLKFENEGVIEQVLVNDGDLVKKGQTIAYQSSGHLISEIAKNEESLIKAQLNMEDILLGFGYSLKDSLTVPKETMNMVKSRSGISDTKSQIRLAQKRYNDSRIRAPFSGVIANLSVKEKSLSSVSDKVCTIVDNRELLANFYILEKEFGIVSKGDSVEIYPIALPEKKFKGNIKYINPIVNESGLILVKANIENRDDLLIDGMNVNVSIKNKTNNVISIPKKAVVDRQNRKVVFTYKSRKSQWNYVKLGQETIDSVVIIEGLKIGDRVIIDGNVNLAHDTEVELIQ